MLLKFFEKRNLRPSFYRFNLFDRWIGLHFKTLPKNEENFVQRMKNILATLSLWNVYFGSFLATFCVENCLPELIEFLVALGHSIY